MVDEALFDRANPSCKHCHGTGKAGFAIENHGQKIVGGKIDQLVREGKLHRTELMCSCIDRANREKVSWLQRHGIDRQPWLQVEEENENGHDTTDRTPDPEASKTQEGNETSPVA